MGPMLHLRWKKDRESGYVAELDLVMPLKEGDIRRRDPYKGREVRRFAFLGDLPASRDPQANRKVPFSKADEIGINLSRAYLELRWERLIMDGDQWIIHYELIAPIGMGSGVIRTKLGGTKTHTMKEPVYDGQVDTPFRDGAHIRWDGLALGLKAYAVYQNHRSLIPAMEPEKAEMLPK